MGKLKIGINGFGRIGREVARRAQAFEMTVIGHDPYLSAADVAGLGVELVALDTLYERSDFISLHAALTDETRGMIDADAIARMKDGARIINAARGALIDDAALAAAIQRGKIGGAALDVYATEPPPGDHPLIGLPGVIHTPHLAANTTDAQVIVAEEAARQIANALLRGDFANVVNSELLAIQ